MSVTHEEIRRGDVAREAGRKRKSGHAAPRKLSRLHKPAEMSLEQWQAALRKQFGREQNFRLKNIGGHAVFSEFEVTNPQSKSTYRVAIRGTRPGDNFCSCPDFATNALGTCKHIEFTLGKLERQRGGKTALRQGFHPPYSEVYLRYGARREVSFRPGTDCPGDLKKLAGRHFDYDGKLRPGAFATFDAFLSKAGSFDHELRCYEDVLRFVAEVRDADRRRDLIDKAFPRGIDSPAFKDLLRVPLYEYQREGALFAAKAGRCLIGDEMGLGKTIQAIAAVEIMAKHLGVERVLIVCPTSLKHQWEREIERFVGRSTCVIAGLRAGREERFRSDSFYKIMNYDTVHRDLDLIGAWSPDLVILDEAQRIKNWNTRTARSVKKIASPYAIVLTGTPLENRLQELVSIVEFIDRHRLGPTYRFLDEHQICDEVGKVIGYRDLDRINKTLEPVLIRRQKDKVLKQLPERLEKNFFVPMTPQQQRHHEENREIVARIVAKWRRYRFLSEADQRRLMIALQNMRMACDSTYLLDQSTEFGVKADELATLLDEIYETPDTKVVIFSQWTRMHELLIRRFESRKWDHVFFHGGVESRKRKDLVDRFREDDRCRAFLATDAGGVGLNLQHASVVTNMDLPWNPAVLEQRIGRVHRLGQTRPVRVVNFVAKGTIEEGMLAVLGFKKSLFAGVLDGGEKEVFLGGSRLNRFMETVEKATAEASPAAMEVAEPPSAEEVQAEAAAPETEEAAEAAAIVVPPASVDPLAGLLQTGMALLEQLTKPARGPSRAASESPMRDVLGRALDVSRDEKTGQTYLKFRMPEPETIDRALKAVGAWLQGLRG
jgi:superfamily II DNA or RNA helicase